VPYVVLVPRIKWKVSHHFITVLFGSIQPKMELVFLSMFCVRILFLRKYMFDAIRFDIHIRERERRERHISSRDDISWEGNIHSGPIEEGGVERRTETRTGISESANRSGTVNI